MLEAARRPLRPALAYASSGEAVDAEERVARCLSLRDAGVRATKIRFASNDWREDVELVARVRDAVGPGFDLMVDANQGWRMPGDLAVPYDPPAWSAERRDWLLPEPLEIASDGTIPPPPGPGLGVVPDFDALERYRTE